ncbi:MAG TPA: hypothetical protein PLN06_01815 [Bacteroidales bacterium]|nr:hypothetical protein [Bacteroidales bacterium]HCI55328.1 hypothetical protein [Bacteroidales bacterium]HOU95345.1 hypothetical protein [Bacteroidales bacterium]HQG35681.1 hypothetical protein [Bacteroidales bacterium]HQG51991.1 hypothetical protein [Bacteroidales bacterium]
MIIYLKNREIDRKLWDTCIRNSRVLKPYACSWFLDIMAPGWEALIDDEYDSVFPLPVRKKIGIKYVTTPVFLQQLGAFSPDKSPEKAINEFLDYLPEFYKFFDLCIGQKVERDGFKVFERANYELDLSRPYEVLWNNFSHSCCRNIEKAERKGIEFTYDIQPEQLIELFIRTKKKIIKGIKQRDIERLLNLMKFSIKQEKGRIEGVTASDKSLLFGQFYFNLPGYINLFFGVNTADSREGRFNYYFINKIIKENAGKEIILDFAGSSIPSVASFMESFGSVNNPYYRIYKNSLPWPLKMLK